MDFGDDTYICVYIYIYIMFFISDILYSTARSNHLIIVTVTIEKTLTHKQLETHGQVLSTVAINALALKHQVISIQRTD